MATPALIRNLSRNYILRAVVCWLSVMYIRLVDLTSSWTHQGKSGSECHLKENTPFISCFWHGRLMMMGSNWPSSRPFYMLISEHPDGKLIARVVQRLGFRTLEGSTKSGGSKALRYMLRILQEGNCVGITPDGPHGPRMRASFGAIALAKLSGAPILPTTFSSTRRKVFNSWDRFIFAHVFGKGVFIWGEPIWVPKDADHAEMERLRQKLENNLNDLTRQADDQCGHVAINPAPINPAGDEELRDTTETVL